VILVDANLLVYAATRCAEQEAAKKWLDGELNRSARVGLPWHSLLAFLRITTSLRIYGTAVASVDDAWAQVRSWLSCSSAWIPEPTARHSQFLSDALKDAGSGGKLIPDAYLAALAIEHGLILCSSDGEFGRFTGLKWTNPLQ
jgi:uncharacterized protein